MTDFDLRAYLEKKRADVNRALADILEHESPSEKLLKAMRYSLMAGGKRLRPILCLAAAEAVGAGELENVLPAACALEMIHTYSLVHDDLPAMDDDELRRGKPTCHVAFGEATAILAGDALLTLAFELLTRSAADNSGSAERILRVIREISAGAGFCGMIAGQMLDIESEGRTIRLSELQAMHSCKTGALIEASVTAGAVLGGGSDTQIAGLKEYARNIGLAFQVADDILNVEGDPALMGKAVGTDAGRSKNTYPSLLGMDSSREMASRFTKSALKAIEIFDNRSEPLRAIAQYIIERRR